MKIHILEVPSSNYKVWKRALRCIEVPGAVPIEEADIDSAEYMLIPGVSNVSSIITYIDGHNIRANIVDGVKEGRLGIIGVCAGFHALCERSEESPGQNGLGLIPGSVVSGRSLHPSRVWPNVGRRRVPINTSPEQFVSLYFNHNYVLNTVTVSDDCFVYYEDICVGYIDHERKIFGYQAHPERSGNHALRQLFTHLHSHAENT